MNERKLSISPLSIMSIKISPLFYRILSHYTTKSFFFVNHAGIVAICDGVGVRVGGGGDCTSPASPLRSSPRRSLLDALGDEIRQDFIALGGGVYAVAGEQALAAEKE